MVGPRWHSHNGTECPVAPTDQVSVMKQHRWFFGLFTENTRLEQVKAGDISWGDVISYCNWSEWDRERYENQRKGYLY